ncbi:7389_t:CDS:2 [Scutellospora calospora]|uniref:7389_t:CDS:1 n=1 Tax=Scutellospora calospora TaxID=85575 RepID=A0ACA9JVX0_9GLOM|nr:7389_t:CDS:2 [Scutellospora calospora]
MKIPISGSFGIDPMQETKSKPTQNAIICKNQYNALAQRTKKYPK